jgi:hypothetical protein
MFNPRVCATELIQSAGKYHVDVFTHPGTILIDSDCETSAAYEGMHSGTTSVLGFTEEYRECQLLSVPPIQIFFESQSVPPAMILSEIVEKIQLVQRNPTLEDNARLDRILGVPAYVSMRCQLLLC